MQATQFRVGNRVRYSDRHRSCFMVTITKVSTNGIDQILLLGDDAPMDVVNSNCHPIPLTPEILEACGFVEFKKNVWRKGRLQWYGHLAYLKNEDTDECYYIPTIVDYLHQLQNLFYSLTGEELEYKTINEVAC